LSYQALAVFPGDPTVVCAAVSGPGGGILRSTDAGATWSLLGNPLFDRVFFGTLVISPADANTLYVTVRGGNIPGGVYRSTDGGQTWVNLPAGIHTGLVTDLVIDPTDPPVLYAGFVGGSGGGATNGVYKTTNGGGTWARLGNGLPAGSAIGSSIRLALAPSAPQNVYATIFYHASNPVRSKTARRGS